MRTRRTRKSEKRRRQPHAIARQAWRRISRRDQVGGLLDGYGDAGSSARWTGASATSPASSPHLRAVEDAPDQDALRLRCERRCRTRVGILEALTICWAIWSGDAADADVLDDANAMPTSEGEGDQHHRRSAEQSVQPRWRSTRRDSVEVRPQPSTSAAHGVAARTRPAARGGRP